MEPEDKANWFKCVYQFHAGYCAESVEQIKPWMKDEILPLAAPKLAQSSIYKILAVGSGTGMVDKYLLQLIGDELKSNSTTQIWYTVVEADAEAVEVCKANLNALDLDVKFTWEVSTINDFLSKRHGDYNMIHFIYSLFVLDEPLNDIISLLQQNYLADDGIFFTMYHDEKQNFFSDIMFSNMNTLMKIYEGGEDFDGFKTDENASGENFHKFDPSALMESVAKYGWKCEVMRKVNKEMVTDIVSRSDEGIEKLGYILGCRNIKDRLSSEELEKIINQIDKTSKKELLNGVEHQYGESLHCLVIINKQ